MSTSRGRKTYAELLLAAASAGVGIAGVIPLISVVVGTGIGAEGLIIPTVTMGPADLILALTGLGVACGVEAKSVQRHQRQTFMLTDQRPDLTILLNQVEGQVLIANYLEGGKRRQVFVAESLRFDDKRVFPKISSRNIVSFKRVVQVADNKAVIFFGRPL